jgi:hypothetical protein
MVQTNQAIESPTTTAATNLRARPSTVTEAG